jgi:hypothetical protein
MVACLPAEPTQRHAARAVERILVRLDEHRGGGQPERGEQQAAENIGGVMLAPVHAGHGDHDRHDDRGDQEQVAPPAAGVADDQDGDADVKACGRGHVAGRECRRGQPRVEVGNVRSRALDHPRDRQESGQFAEHDHGEEDHRPPATGDGEEHDAADDAHDEDVLGGPEAAADQAPVVQRRCAVRGEPVRNRMVAEQVAVAVAGDHDQLADAGEDTDDQNPAHHYSGRDAAVLSSPVMLHGRLRFCWLEVGAGLGLKALGHGIGHRCPGGLAG